MIPPRTLGHVFVKRLVIFFFYFYFSLKRFKRTFGATRCTIRVGTVRVCTVRVGSIRVGTVRVGSIRVGTIRVVFKRK